MKVQNTLPGSLVRYFALAGMVLACTATAGAMAQQDGANAGQVTAESVETEAAAEPSTLDKMVEKSKELMETGGEKAKEGWDKTKEVSGEAWDKTKEVSGETWDKTKEVSGEGWDKTKEVSGKVWNKTKEVTGDAVDATKNTASKVGAAAKSGYEAAKETYQEAGAESESAATSE